MAGKYNIKLKQGCSKILFFRSKSGFDLSTYTSKCQFRTSYNGDVVLELNESAGLQTQSDGIWLTIEDYQTKNMSGGGVYDLMVTNGTRTYCIVEGDWSVEPAVTKDV